MLENIRFHSGETKNSDTLSRELAELCECYVNDAFGTAHRAHASTAGVAKLVDNRAAGYCVAKEVESLNRILQSRRMGFVAVLGGAKVSDKIGVIESLLSRVERLLIGGAMAYTFLAARGIDVGESRIETEHLRPPNEYFSWHNNGHTPRIALDHRCAEAFDAQADVVQIDDSAIPNGLMGLDVGPKTAEAYASCLREARTVFGTVRWAFSNLKTLPTERESSPMQSVNVGLVRGWRRRFRSSCGRRWIR